MICLHCGHCCINYEVIIVDNPELGIREDNLKSKPTGVRCQHLTGQSPGEYNCTIHSHDWYQETPCFQFTQVEKSNLNCRIGEHIITNKLLC